MARRCDIIPFERVARPYPGSFHRAFRRHVPLTLGELATHEAAVLADDPSAVTDASIRSEPPRRQRSRPYCRTTDYRRSICGC